MVGCLVSNKKGDCVAGVFHSLQWLSFLPHTGKHVKPAIFNLLSIINISMLFSAGVNQRNYELMPVKDLQKGAIFRFNNHWFRAYSFMFMEVFLNDKRPNRRRIFGYLSSNLNDLVIVPKFKLKAYLIKQDQTFDVITFHEPKTEILD